MSTPTLHPCACLPGSSTCLHAGMAALAAVLLWVPLLGCASPARAVRLDTREGAPRAHTARGEPSPVLLQEDEFKQALAGLARDVQPWARPVRQARGLMHDSWRGEAYTRRPGRYVVLASWGGWEWGSVWGSQPPARSQRHLTPAVAAELTLAYGRWCERTGRAGDCLSLLQESTLLDSDSRYTLAMALALGSVWEETRQALVGMADPVAVQANIVSAMAMYMMLWVIPEPVSKGLAALLTASLMAYLGVDTVWSLMVGWRRLVEESDRATSFLQLREAGERYGKVLGKNAARVFVMLAAAAIGSTAGLATKGPGLPGFSQATALAETQGGFRLAALAEVEAVAVSAEGAFTIALAPGAVAMSAHGHGGVTLNNHCANVEIVDAKGAPLGEFDEVAPGRFIEDKSARGVYTNHPITGKPVQTVEQWAERQIYEKTRVRIENLLRKAAATRPAAGGTPTPPTLQELKSIRSFLFRIQAGDARIQAAVRAQLDRLKRAFPDWSFEASFGP